MLEDSLDKCWRSSVDVLKVTLRDTLDILEEELGGSERGGDPGEWSVWGFESSRVKSSLGGSSGIKLDQVGSSRDPGLKIA